MLNKYKVNLVKILSTHVFEPSFIKEITYKIEVNPD